MNTQHLVLKIRNRRDCDVYYSYITVQDKRPDVIADEMKEAASEAEVRFPGCELNQIHTNVLNGHTVITIRWLRKKTT